MVQSPSSSSGEEEEEDFMSDKFLAVATAGAPGGKKVGSTSAETYSERRRKELDRAKDRGRILSRAERERLARRQGLGRSLIEIAEGEDRGKRKREEEEKEQGESKALRMMKAMGYVAGDALGKKDDGGGNDDDKEAPSIDKEADGEKGRDMTAPLPIDERWIGARVRHGIGLLSRSIHAASAKQAEEAAKGDLEDFRKRATKEHEARHCEVLLKRARKTCEDLDRQQDIEVRDPYVCSIPPVLSLTWAYCSIPRSGLTHSSSTSRRMILHLIERASSNRPSTRKTKKNTKLQERPKRAAKSLSRRHRSADKKQSSLSTSSPRLGWTSPSPTSALPISTASFAAKSTLRKTRCSKSAQARKKMIIEACMYSIIMRNVVVGSLYRIDRQKIVKDEKRINVTEKIGAPYAVIHDLSCSVKTCHVEGSR